MLWTTVDQWHFLVLDHVRITTRKSLCTVFHSENWFGPQTAFSAEFRGKKRKNRVHLHSWVEFPWAQLSMYHCAQTQWWAMRRDQRIPMNTNRSWLSQMTLGLDLERDLSFFAWSQFTQRQLSIGPSIFTGTALRANGILRTKQNPIKILKHHTNECPMGN